MTDRYVYDPRPARPVGVEARAARLGTLDGAVIAVVDNGKTHAGRLLDLVVDELGRRWSITGVVHLGPPSPGHGGNVGDADVAAEWGATAAVAAVGDCGACTSGSVMDAVIFERLGIPAVAIVTRPFLPTARAVAELNGLRDHPVVAVDHPITSLDDAELAGRARAAAPQVAAALLGRAPRRDRPPG